MKKVNWTQLLSIGGMALGLAASVVSNIAGEKKLDETVAKKVQEALSEKK